MSAFYQAGRYRCEVTQQAMVKASTGTPQFVLKVRIIGIYTAPNDVDELQQQYERSIYRSITDKTMPYVLRDLDALGFQGGSLAALDPHNPTHQSFVGIAVDCMCKHGKDQQTGDDKERWSLAWANQESTAIEGEGLKGSDYRLLDALFNKAAKGTTAAKPKPAPVAAPAVNGAGVAVDDDDVPF